MRGDKNTHGQGERVKIPLLPWNVDKKSVNDSGPTVGSWQTGLDHLNTKPVCYSDPTVFNFTTLVYDAVMISISYTGILDTSENRTFWCLVIKRICNVRFDPDPFSNGVQQLDANDFKFHMPIWKPEIHGPDLFHSNWNPDCTTIRFCIAI